jgi:hypothetical protein
VTKRIAIIAALAAIIVAGLPQGAGAAARTPPTTPPPPPGKSFAKPPAFGRATHKTVPSRLPSPIHPVLRPQAVAPPSTPFGGLWTPLGPAPIFDEKYCCPIRDDYGNTSGRITSIAVSPINPAVAYAGSAGGGVWKTSDSGANWTPLTDASSSLAIGALAVDATGQVIFAGTGEDNRSDSQSGVGILRSTDGGATWSQTLGGAFFNGKHIGGLAVDRTTSGATMRVFAATDAGLFESNDEGATWTRVTSYLAQVRAFQGLPGPSGEVFQIIQDPTIPTTFWLVAGDFCNTEWGDILISLDVGITWTRVTPPGLTISATRIGLGVGPSGTAYMAAADCTYRSLWDMEKTVNGGASWTQISASTPGLIDYFNLGAGQGDYDNVVAVDPTDGNRAVFGGVTMLATSDGGAHFTDIGKAYLGASIHPDYHAVGFTAANSFYVGNDGGMWRTANLGTTWTDLNATLNTIQFWQGNALDTTHLLGGAQDNGTSGHLPGAGPLPGWQAYSGADGGFTAIDPTSGSTVYTEYQFGTILKGSSTLTGSATSPYDSFVEAGPCRPSVLPSDPACFDFVDFVAPFVMDPSNPLRLLAGTYRLYLTTDAGGSGATAGGSSHWTVISPDLTTGYANFTNRQDVLSALNVGPAGVTGPVMTGSALGAVYMSTNAAGTIPSTTTWVNITGNLPQPTANPVLNTFNEPNEWITGVTFNPANPAEAWVTIGGINVGHVWHTMNAGSTATIWTDISSGSLPAALGSNVGADAIVLDPNDPSTIYVGTDGIDHSAWVCTSCGGANADGRWMLLGSGLPAVKISALTLTRDGKNLIAWTHGRGAWSLARPALTTFYFAEGYTGSGFTESLSLLTPNVTGTASIDYYLEGGAHLSGTATVFAGKVTVVDVNSAVGPNHEVSAKVTLPGPGVAERTIHFNIPGQWHGSTDTVGVTAPSTEWNFAEGSTLTNGGPLIFSEFLTLQNPNASAVPVTLNYFTDSGLTPVKGLTLAANSRTTVEVFHGDTTNVSSCVANGTMASCGVGPGIGGVSVQVKSSTLPIIAERPFYVNGYDFGDGVIRDGHNAFGATAAGSTWNFAEGTTLRGFKEYLTLQNPGSAVATVNLNYFTDAGAHPVKTLAVNPHSRVTVEVFHGDSTTNQGSCVPNGAGANCGVGPNVGGVSVQVASNQPIVAERPMYMVLDFGTSPVAGAHVVVGATGLGQLFGFAAGSTVAGENDYLTIQNPGATDAHVVVTYYPDGSPIVRSFTVPARTRHTVEVFKAAEGPGPGFGHLGIVVASDQPVLVEKPTYNSTPGAYGATDTLGYGPSAF